jgi:hypothetical protein
MKKEEMQKIFAKARGAAKSGGAESKEWGATAQEHGAAEEQDDIFDWLHH